MARAGFMLDVASMLSSVGLSVMEADIKSPPSGSSNSARRVFRFLVCDERGGKLSTSASSTVLYTLSVLMGRAHAPLVVPSAVFA